MDKDKLLQQLGYMSINITAAVELLLDKEHPQQLPKPTHFQCHDDCTWYVFSSEKKIYQFAVIAIKFDNGAIFDMVNGWRVLPDAKPEEIRQNERLVPRYLDEQGRNGKDAPSVPDAEPENIRHNIGTVSTDQRIVPRALLEICRKVVDAYYNKTSTLPYSPVLILEGLDKVLQIEKPELSAPPVDVSRGALKACNKYQPVNFYGSICAKCGHYCEDHKDAAKV